MSEALLASHVLLWIVVVVLAGVVAALVRQVGILHERVAPVGALATADGLAVGTRLRVLPNHACATATMHARCHVVDRSRVVIDVWERVAGW